MTFAYGPARARYKRTDTDNNGTATDTADDETTVTLYVGSVEKVIAADNTYQYRRTLAGGVALVIEDYDASHSATGTATKYLLRDHLGSLTSIVDNLGAMVQELSYDPWGQRRNAADWQALSSLSLTSFDSSMTRRGFTGHEMVDTVGIIHMNGRIYDATLGRFLQADPVIQFPDYSQSRNRYSYVLNNPLAYTDPTGHFIPIFTALAVGIAVGFKFKLVATAVVIGLGVFADSLVQGVPLDKAFLAGVSAAALTAVAATTFPVGEFGLNLATAGHVATVATVGGITTALQGGRFGNGFLSAGLGSAAPVLPGLRQLASTGIPGRALVSAVTAGTVSEITGGKFANGAVSAAFVALVSSAAWSAAERAQNQNSIDRIHNLPDSLEERQAIFNEGLDAAKAQNLIVDDVNIAPRLNEINIATRNRLTGGHDYQQFTSKSDALAFLKANPGSFAADGVYYGNGNVSIYATAVSSGTRLSVGSLFASYVNSGNYFGPVLTGVENVIQTITHETGHHLGYSHGNSMYNREFLAIKRYRQGP